MPGVVHAMGGDAAKQPVARLKLLCLLQVRNSLVSPKRRSEAQQGSQWRTLGNAEIRARTMASEARRKAMLQTLPAEQWELEKK